MAVQVQQLMASLQDIEALATAVKADAAASSKVRQALLTCPVACRNVHAAIETATYTCHMQRSPAHGINHSCC